MITRFEVLVASTALLLGLVHGCYDWMVYHKQVGDSLVLGLIEVTSLYYILVWPYIIVWIFWTEAAVIIFLVFTAVHWGQEDLYSVRGLLKQKGGNESLFFIGRGGMTVVFPLLKYEKEYEAVMNSVLLLFGPNKSLGILFNPVTITLLVILVSLSLIVYHINNRSIINLCQTVLLSLWFVFIPVYISIPVYLAVYHSGLRMIRIYSIGVKSLKQMVFYPVPYLLGSIVIFSGAVLLIPSTQSSLLSMTSAYLVFLSILTVPHTLITYGLDKRQGIL